MSRLPSARAHAWIALLMRLYLGAMFLFACAHKIARPEAFAVDVATYQLLPVELVNGFALFVPWLELVTGAALVIGVRVRAACALMAAMMTAFMVALAWALHLHLNMSCGCFASQGAVNDPISWHTMLRDGAWLLMIVYVALVDRNPIGINRLWNPRRHQHA